VDATGKMVMVANYDGSSVTSFPINADGTVGPATSFIQQHGSSVNPQRQTAPHAHSITVDPGNHFALVCDLGLDQVLVFKINPEKGSLMPNDPPFFKTTPGIGPRHLAFQPNGRFAYMISELACTMTAYRFDPNSGTLVEMQSLSTLPAGVPMQTNYVAAEVVVHPSGKFVYGSTRGHNSIAAYRIDPDSGKMTLIEIVPSGGLIPRSFNIAPSGRFLLAANQDSGTVNEFRIDPDTGRLTPTGEQVKITKPVCVTFVAKE
jgi:6-phosphogluconolactonase